MVDWNNIKGSTITMLRCVGFKDNMIESLLDGKVKNIICNTRYLAYVVEALNNENISCNVEIKDSDRSYIYIIGDNLLQGYF